MKRITALLAALMLTLLFSLTAFADDIYIVDDGEDVFVPVPETTTAKQEEATTAPSSGSNGGSLFEGMGSLDEYIDDFSGLLSGGIDSLLSGFENNLGQLMPENTTSSQPTTALPGINSGERPTQSQPLTTVPVKENEQATAAENTTAGQKSEVASVLIVNGEKDSEDSLSGSTLTLLVFIAAIVVLILAAAIVLVIMTRRTEYNSAVMDKSTIPSVEKPRAMPQFTNDNIGDDGNDYSNITYWNS